MHIHISGRAPTVKPLRARPCGRVRTGAERLRRKLTMRQTLFVLGVVALGLATSVAARAQDHAGHVAADRLGSVTFPNTCAEAVKPQVNRGVALLHSFWFDEAIRTFNDVA